MIKQWTEELYNNHLKNWWPAHGWPDVPMFALPKDGLVVFDNDAPILAGFLYLSSNSSMCWLEWVVSNPISTEKQRSSAFHELIPALHDIAKKAGAVCVFTSSPHKGYIRRMTEFGYLETDTGNTNMIKALYG